MLYLFQTVFVPQFHGEQLQGKDYNLECQWMDVLSTLSFAPAQEKPSKIKDILERLIKYLRKALLYADCFTRHRAYFFLREKSMVIASEQVP